MAREPLSFRETVIESSSCIASPGIDGAMPFQNALTVRFARLALFLALSLLPGCAAYGPARHGEKIHRNVVYAVRDGKKLHLDLYVPAKPRPAPVIVWMHGGGWKYGFKGYNLLIRDLTRDGFAIASVEYSLLRGGRPCPADEDCRDAAEWLRARGSSYGIDGRRMGFAGESAGGHLASLVGTREGRNRVKAVCALYPPTDLVAMGERYSRYKRLSIFSQMFGGDIKDRRKVAWEASPVAHVSRSSPPFLLYHGDRDWLVPLDQSKKLDAALRRAGVACELNVVPGKGHAFHLDDSQLSDVAAFFRSHL
jgi:acetyl esterase/lipase